MSKIIGLAALFAFGAFTGGALVYSTKKAPVTEVPDRREVIVAEPVVEGPCVGERD
jgi:hypothetical protein